MTKDKQEFDKGYQAAIEAIRKQLEQGSRNPADDANNNDMQSPNQSDQSQGSSNSNNNNNNNNSSNSNNSNSQSRTSNSDENQGVVRDEDCIGQSGLDDIPETPGGMISKSDGDKIAEKEGYEKEGGSENRLDDEWKDTAIKAAQKMIGDKYGKLKSKIEGLYRGKTDWKRELRKIVGYAISPEDFRRAYANKNILVSQDRMARTDKNKYDTLDYIIAVIDSSGSMSDEDLKICLSEIYNLALQKKPLILYVIQCDTKIQDVQTYHNLWELKRNISSATVKGRGGTDFKDVWNYLRTDRQFKGRQAELVMLFTDGGCAQYKRDPISMRNLCWVILDNPSFNLEFKETSTKCVYINTKDIKG